MLESRVNSLLNKVDNIVPLKSKWLWLFGLLILSLSGFAQNQGYSWQFSSTTPPFTSTAAIAGSPAYTLTSLGTGSLTSGVSQTVEIGSTCTSTREVGLYTEAFGFRFSNTDGTGGHPVAGAYTIEMVINPSTDVDYRRLVGFTDVSVPGGSGIPDYGIYIRPNGSLLFYAGGNELPQNIMSDATVTAGSWYHLVFTRNATTKVISCYQNKELIGEFNDAANTFIPSSGNSYAINFLKDDGTDESGGKIAKISVFNFALTTTQIDEQFISLCSTGQATGTANYIPKFSGPTTFTNSIIYENGSSVGIGTTTPFSYKLAVGGGVIAEKVTVKLQSDWADYVFEDKYKLPTLAEVEKYIAANKHLPGVPSASEVKEKGIDLGDNQIVLLKKIEELTLYIIEQHKAQEAMKATIQELKEKMQKINCSIPNRDSKD